MNILTTTVITTSLRRGALCVVVGGLLVASCAHSTATHTVAPASIVDSAVQVVANGCRPFDIDGAGLVVAPDRIATVAHVVAGASQITVRGIRGDRAATVVYFDPVHDVAVLKVDPGLGEPIPIGAAVAGDRGDVVVYRDNAPVELTAEVRRRVDIRTADIYGDGTHTRPGYELSLDIRAGDSGAVVVVNDKAVALVWATSKLAEGRAWAMQTSLIADQLSLSTKVDNGHCV